jgi:uncharacterized membrane protein
MMIPTKESIWNPLFISVFIANALLNVSQQMVQPLLTAYAKAIGAADVILGVVASIFTVTALLLLASRRIGLVLLRLSFRQ